MLDTKPVLASKAVWGALIALAATLLELVTQASALLGAMLALYGRITATRKLRG
jgi:hypothetical protein